MKHYLWVFVEKFGVLVFRVASLVLLARILTPTDFGIFAMAVIFVSVASTLVDSGMCGSLIRKKDPSDIDYSTVFFFNLTLGCLLFFLIYVSAPSISQYYDNQDINALLRTLGVVVVIRALSLVQIAQMTKALRFRDQSVVLISSSAVSLVVAYYMARNGYGYWALVGQQIAEASITLLLFWVISGRVVRVQFSMTVLAEHFSFGFKLMLASMMDSLHVNAIIVFIGRTQGAMMTGFYAQAAKINEIFLNLVVTTIDKGAFPLLVKARDNVNGYLDYCNKLLSVACFLSFFFLTLLSLCAAPIVEIVLGVNWSESAWILEVLAISGFGFVVEAITRSFLKSQGRSDLILRLSSIKLVLGLSILGSLATLGINFLVWGFVVVSVLGAFLNIFMVERALRISSITQIMAFYKFLIASIFVLIVMNMLPAHLSGSSLVDFLLISILALILYLATSAVLYFNYLYLHLPKVTSYIRKFGAKQGGVDD